MTSLVEIDTDAGFTIVEVNEANPAQIVEQPNPEIQVVDVVAQGPQGPRGEPGPNAIGAVPIVVADVTTGDVLSFTGINWSNRRQESLTDGGNF